MDSVMAGSVGEHRARRDRFDARRIEGSGCVARSAWLA
jgi:hypothetical protein